MNRVMMTERATATHRPLAATAASARAKINIRQPAACNVENSDNASLLLEAIGYWNRPQGIVAHSIIGGGIHRKGDHCSSKSM